ncbi:MAG: hypothetical protein RRC34_06145 [Lentisphaeria bacterium]|nr:hypothetical protein [Lentisphaeria bacterium]
MSNSTPERSILTGVNYIPQVGMIEDFSPLWIMDRWTKERMEEDFRIMSSLGMSIVRFHISPSQTDKVEYPGLKPGKYIEMMDAAVEFQETYGITILFDIGSFFEGLTEDIVRLYVSRYKGRIRYYQMGNEIYEETSDADNFRHMVELIRLARSIDPDARFSSDVKSVDLYRYRETFPDDVAELDFHPIHFYCPVDHHGWDDVSLDVFRRFCSEGGEVEYPEGYHKIHWCRGMGFGDLDKPRWVTEACGQGYFRWGNVTPPRVMAEGWKKMMEVSRVENGPEVVLHHCFRDKMSWREFGIGQSGVVALDGAPKEIAETFKEESLRSMPDTDPRKHVRISLSNCTPSKATIAIENRNMVSIEGSVCVVVGDHASKDVPLKLEKHASRTLELDLDPLCLKNGRNNVFVRLKMKNETLWGYGTVTREYDVELEKIAPFEGVVYPDGLEKIEAFLVRYGKNLPVITGPFTGDECEPGYRLKCVLDHLFGGDCRVTGSMDCVEATRQPFAIIGTEAFNPLLQLMKESMASDRQPEALFGQGAKGFVQIVPLPFGNNRNGHPQRSIGIRQPLEVPEVLYIGGVDLEGLKMAAYDLIRRIWPNTVGEPMLTEEARDMLDL